MSTLTRTRLGFAIALMAALAGCSGPCDKLDSINGPALNANSVDLSTYVAVGTSLSSGYESGGLVDRHQVHSFPSIFARQIGKTVDLVGGSGTFTQPTINQDGIPALLEIKSFSPLVISNAGRTTGAPTNLSQPFAYHNLGIPGAILVDLVDTTNYHNTVPPVNRQNFTYFNIIQRTRGTVLAQALSLAPTIMSIEYGANEVLGPSATGGVAPNPATGQAYAQLMTIALNTIHSTLQGTRVVVLNVPDVTTIPFFTTLSAFTVSATTGQPLPLVGANGPLAPGDLVLLSAAGLIATTGTGIPAGGVNYLNPSVPSNGQALDESLILRAAEVSATQAVIAQLNAVVDSVSQRPFVAKADFAGLLATISSTGLSLGGADYTNEFVTGGLFGLDGVHPNDLGYALIANTMIDAINARFGCFVPPVNALTYASTNASALAPVRDHYPLVRGLDESFRMLFGLQR
jgi:lysophospholipase L1-like esterase